MINEIKIHTILKCNPQLCCGGIVSPNNPNYRSEESFMSSRRYLRNASDEIERACKWLSLIEKTKQINRRLSSYGLKRIAERYTGGYIANGSFILAALYMDFDIKQIRDSPNAALNVSKRSIKLARPIGFNRNPNLPPIVRPSGNIDGSRILDL